MFPNSLSYPSLFSGASK